MAKVLVLYYSTYGHIETMAQALAEGARSAGAEVDIKRVPETAPEDVARDNHFKLDQAAPIANVEDLGNYDAIIIGTGHVSAACPRKWRRSSTRQAVYGPAARSTARSALPLRRPQASMAVRKPRCSL